MVKNTALSQTLVIVESPAKCKKIEQYLGPGYKCMASFGHLRELGSLDNVNIENNFAPTYTIVAKKKKQIAELKADALGGRVGCLLCPAGAEKASGQN